MTENTGDQLSTGDGAVEPTNPPGGDLLSTAGPGAQVGQAGGDPAGQQDGGEPAGQPEGAQPPEGGEGAPGEGAPGEINLPDGLSADDPFVADLKAMAVNNGWGQEGMDALGQVYQGLLAKAAALSEQQEKDNAAASEKALREAWGGNFDRNLKSANAGLKKLFPNGNDLAEFNQMLDETGLGDNPILIRAFLAIDRALGEDAFESGRDAGGRTGPMRGPGGEPMLEFPSMKGR